MLNFSVRPAAVDEVGKIATLERRYSTQPWSEEQILGEMENPLSEFWVITDDETDELLIAYLVFRKHGDWSQILNIVVDLNYRGTGFAQKLLGRLVHDSVRRGDQKLSLEVRKSNEPAIQLYQKLAFTVREIKKSYYSNGEDAWVMDRDLEGQESDLETSI